MVQCPYLFIFLSLGYQKMLVSVCKNRLWGLSSQTSITIDVNGSGFESVAYLLNHVCSLPIPVLLKTKISNIVHSRCSSLLIPNIIGLSHSLIENRTRYHSAFKLEYISHSKKAPRITACKLKKRDTIQICKQQVAI